MKSLLSLAGGGAILTIWKAIPAVVKVPMIFGAGMYAAAELNMDINHSWFSPDIYRGEAAKGEAQSVDPAATRRAIDAGKPVTGAAATIAAQVEGAQAEAARKAAEAQAQLVDPAETARARQMGKEVTGAAATVAAQVKGLDADAIQKAAVAKAAIESEYDILDNEQAGRRVSTTEELKLVELRQKRAEALQLEANAEIADARKAYAKGFYRAVGEMKKKNYSDNIVDWMQPPRR